MPEDTTWLDMAKDFLAAFHVTSREILTILRTPTPIKTVKNVQVDEHGCIGNGFLTPNPYSLWTCPSSHEAWINRITVTSPNNLPATPLTTGEAIISGSTGQIISWLPHRGDVAPVQLLESRGSAPHLTAGEQILIVGDLFPVGTILRFDFQIVLETGTSEFTPLWGAPMKLREHERAGV